MPENSERKSDVEASENEKKRNGLKNRAISASSKLRHSLIIRKGKRRVEGRGACVSIKDVRDNKEVQAVQAFRETLLSNELLPARHDDYYMLLRFDKRITEFAEEKFQRDGIDLKTGSMVVKVTDKEITTKAVKNGGEVTSFPYGMMVWSTGIGTRPMIRGSS